MASFERGGTQIGLIFTKVEGALAAEDRQLAWELSVAVASRLSLRGKIDDRGEDHFRGEVLAESFDELEAFLAEARALAGRYPVNAAANDHLGFFIAQTVELVVRPFYERWQAEYRYWWETNRSHGEPFIIQNNYPRLEEMLDDWIALRKFWREVLRELSAAYGFADLLGASIAASTQLWI